MPSHPIGFTKEIRQIAHRPDALDASAAAEGPGEIADRAQRIRQMPFQARADRRQLVARKDGGCDGQPVIGRKADHHAPRARVDRRHMWGDIAPVCATRAGQHRPSIAFCGANRLGHQRIAPIRADHDPRLFRDLCPTPWPTANSGHSTG